MEENKPIPPFRRFVIQNFPFIEEDFDALTNYGLLSKVVEYLNKVIDGQNEVSEEVETLSNQFNNLKNYIDTYFDNLDVQEEINRKLDSMAESGVLTDMVYGAIETYIQPQIDVQNREIQAIDKKVEAARSGAPLAASSTSGMTDTTRIYVNTTDGKWYYWDGDLWEIGGTYQATEDSNTVSLLVNEMTLVYPVYPYVTPTVGRGEPTVGQTGVNTSIYRYSTEKIATHNYNHIHVKFKNTTVKDFSLRIFYFNNLDECTQQGSYFEVLAGATLDIDYYPSQTAVAHDYMRLSGKSLDVDDLTSYYTELSNDITVTYIPEEKFILQDDKGTTYTSIVSRIAGDESRISALEAESPAIYPSYYQSQLNDAVSAINANMDEVGQHGDTFAFITDTHWSNNTKHSPALLKYLKDKCNFRFIVHGGDYITGGTDVTLWTNNLRTARNAWNEFDSENAFLTLFGNHDANNQEGSQYRISVNAVYDILFKRTEPCITKWNNETVIVDNPYSQYYYYVDNDITKTRNFYLSSSHGSIGDIQLAWLSAQLTAMPSGYKSVVFCHWIYNDGAYTGNGIALKNICDQHTDKVLAIVTGHTHFDKVDHTSAGIPIIFTTTDTHFPAEDEGGVTPDATVGTINEQAFDVMTVNYETGTIKCVRIGRGSNRTVYSEVD